MATRPCLRCCKLLPESATFCRRCGLTMRPGPAVASRATPQPIDPNPAPLVAAESPERGGLVAATAVGAISAVVALFTASSPRTTFYRSDPGPPALLSPGTDEGAARLARLRDQLAEAHDRVAATRDRLAAARERLERRARLGPWPVTATPPMPAPPPTALPPAPRPAVPAERLPRQDALHRPGKRTTMEDVIRSNVLRPGAPRIEGLSHLGGPAGRGITIDGKWFAGATRVLFASAGRNANGWADARFRIRDDRRLIVAVPDLGPNEQPAAIVVVTPAGAAITVPAGAALVSPDRPAPDADAGFIFLAGGASLAPRRGTTMFVDRGATVHAASGSLVVVRAGGGVERARTDCLILRETPRPQPRDLALTPVLDVPAVNACFVDSLFQYAGH